MRRGMVSKTCPPVKEGRTRRCRGQLVLRRRIRPPRRFAPPLLDEEGNGFQDLPSCEGGQDATMSRTGGKAVIQNHHPVASRHPSSTRRGMVSKTGPPGKGGRARRCRGQVVRR